MKTKTSKTAKKNKKTPFYNKLPSVIGIFRNSLKILWSNKKLFLGIVIVYTFLSVLLVRGLSGIGDLDTLYAVLDSGIGKFSGGIGNFAFLVQSSGTSSNASAGLYQSFLFIIISLATVWALRQVHAGATKLRIRDAFYKGMYPLIPVLLVFLVICLQLVPLIIAVAIYAALVGSGLDMSGIIQILGTILAVALAGVTVYLTTSSLFALYIATLPDMTPIKALRSARDLVRYRYWIVLRKNISLVLVLLIASMVIMLPIIIFLTPITPWVFFILTMFLLPIAHSYMYSLYRELLIE